jgi:alpha-glucosidase
MKFVLIVIQSIMLVPLSVVFTLAQDTLFLHSPDRKLEFKVFLTHQGGDKNLLAYEIKYQGKAIITPSFLGIKTNEAGSGHSDWYKHLTIESVSRITRDTVWTPVYGERSSVKDHYHELVINLTSGISKGVMQLIVRAYNESIAFRYFFPEQISTQIIEIGDEYTFFTLPKGTMAWYTHGAQQTSIRRDVKNWDADAELPLTFELPNGLYACIAQAAQIDYPRVRLQTTPQEGVLKSKLYSEVTGTSPMLTPWRVVMVADRAGQLLENNDVILNLNKPTALTNTQWVKPGQAMREMTLSTSGAKALVDFAVEQEIDYIHFDAGWYGHEYEASADATTVNVDPRRNPKGDLDLQEAIRYAKENGKMVMLYVNHRALEKQLDTLLPLYKSWGVSGIKFGFVHTGSHHWTTWLHEAIRKAAAYQMVVDVHDEYRPTGYSRTYPNLLTQEGVYGNEEFPDATQNTILPYTRFIAGAADYTFCFYTQKFKPVKSKTTNGHQLALPVIYYSPLQFVFWYGKPEHFPNRSDIAFWKGLPTVWDDTKVLDGKPGEYTIIARRKGNTWYVGAITNTEGRVIEVKFDFLDKGRKYKAKLYEDVEGTPKGDVTIRSSAATVNTKSKIKVKLKPSGGVAIKIELAQ